jgi:hypothetical protein
MAHSAAGERRLEGTPPAVMPAPAPPQAPHVEHAAAGDCGARALKHQLGVPGLQLPVAAAPQAVGERPPRLHRVGACVCRVAGARRQRRVRGAAGARRRGHRPRAGRGPPRRGRGLARGPAGRTLERWVRMRAACARGLRADRRGWRRARGATPSWARRPRRADGRARAAGARRRRREAISRNGRPHVDRGPSPTPSNPIPSPLSAQIAPCSTARATRPHPAPPPGPAAAAGAPDQMYIEDWDSFYVQAEELWRKDPIKTRYCIKYRHTEGKLVLKVTDDVVVSARGRGGGGQGAPRGGAARSRARRAAPRCAARRCARRRARLPPPPAPRRPRAAVPEVQDGPAGGREAHGEAQQSHVPAHGEGAGGGARCGRRGWGRAGRGLEARGAGG